MLYSIFVARRASLVLLSFFTIALSYTPSAFSEELRELADLLTTNASRLALGNDPRIDQETLKIAAAYSHIAKGFWLDERCKFADDADDVSVNSFRNNIAVSTNMMRRILESIDGINGSDADRLTQSIQMYSLQEMSAAKFYGCGTEASLVHSYAVREAAFWAQTTSQTNNQP